MNQNAVLMCMNIPPGIQEEEIYELFCNAGPIQDIHFGKTHKSVFVIYEFKEAIATAKEIFKDVKLYGRPIRMFDKEDIEKIHAKQEEEVNSRQEYENYNWPLAKKRRYEEYPRHFNNYQQFYSPEGPSYQENHSIGPNYQNFARFNYEEGTRYQEESRPELYNQNNTPHADIRRFNRVHPEQTVSNNDLSYRPDLVPKNSKYYEDEISENENNFRNPYEKPVTRHNFKDKSYRYDDYRNRKYDKPYDRRYHRNHRETYSPPPRNQYRNHRHQNYSYQSRRH